MNEPDPVDKVIALLPDEPPSPQRSARILRQAQTALVREGSLLARFDRWTLERVVPVALILCALGYATDIVRFFGRVFG
jgi:hypothetical protein